MPKSRTPKRPIDLRKDATRNRQAVMAQHLRRTGLSRLVSETDGRITLPKAYCQTRGAKLRWKLEKKAVAASEDLRPGERKMMVTVLLSEMASQDRPFDPKLLIRIQESLENLFKDSPEIRVMIGAIETDFNRASGGRAFWDHSAHLILVVKAREVSDVTELFKDGLGLESTSDTRRPVLSRPIYDTAGAARYAFKSFTVGPVCERSSWVGRGPTGRTRTFTRKIRLKRPQLISWLRSLEYHDPSDRLIWHSRTKR